MDSGLETDKDNICMNLQGQDRTGSRGYAMAALLVSLGVMSILMTVALPVWRQAATREKEAELVFRGEQYARAIGLFQRKFGGAFPPSVDLLVEQKFLRKKYKDPMTPDGEFQILYQNSAAAVQALQGGPAVGAAQPGGTLMPTGRTSQTPQSQPTGSTTTTTTGSRPPIGPQGGVIGVSSRSKEKSIRLYKGRDQYDQWQFVYTPVTLQPGAPGAPLQPGQRPPGAGPGGSAPIQLGPFTPGPGGGMTPPSGPGPGRMAPSPGPAR
jgi:type II secretory pathway pseudopilin PulG